jgi:hypothetical protein
MHLDPVGFPVVSHRFDFLAEICRQPLFLLIFSGFFPSRNDRFYISLIRAADKRHIFVDCINQGFKQSL